MHSIESFLPSVAKPARYTGGEWNMARKDPASVAVRWAASAIWGTDLRQIKLRPQTRSSDPCA